MSDSGLHYAALVGKPSLGAPGLPSFVPPSAVTSALTPTPAPTSSTPAGPSPSDILAQAGAPPSVLQQAQTLPLVPPTVATTNTLGG